MNDTRSLDANSTLTAFWAPFLLLHLGGPDAITAYALEDNELWLRHLLGLIVQTGIALYVFLISWGGFRLSMLCNLMFFTGLIKYGERTWVLRSASNEKFRESIVTHGTRYRDETQIWLEELIRTSQGYSVRSDRVSEVRLPVDPSIFNNKSLSGEDKLVAGHGLLIVAKRLFLDSIIDSNDIDTSKTLFKHMSSENVFEVIEIQLGWIYDLLHTKSMLLYTRWGLTLRLIACFLTCLVLVLFIFLDHKHQYSKIDILITFLLLTIAIVLEMYAALIMISSDQFVVWLNRHRKTSILQVLTYFPLLKSPRWSNKMSQYSLIRFSMKEKSLPCHNILKLLNTDKKLETNWNITYKDVPEVLKKLIVRYVKVKSARTRVSNVENSFGFLPASSGTIGFRYTGTWGRDSVESNKRAFGKYIMTWHIITELWYYLDIEDIKLQSEIDAEHCKFIKWISRYMFYLLVIHPSMLSLELTSEIIVRHTVNETVDVLRGSQVLSSKTEACKKLIKCRPQFRAEFGYSELGYTLGFADSFINRDKIEGWNILGWTWLEILAYAASECKGNLHAQQLRRGGELLTHVWLLMAQYGLTHHFLPSDHPYTQVSLIAN